MPDTPDIAPPILAPAAVASPVLDYAPADRFGASAITIWSTRVLALVHVLLGGALITFAAAAIADRSDLPNWLVGILLAVGVMESAAGIRMFLPSPANWRRTQTLLALVTVASTSVIWCGVGIFLYYRRAPGWENLTAVGGLVLAIFASGPVFLNQFSLWYLMRPRALASLNVSPTERFPARRAFMRTMWIAWALAALTVAGVSMT